MGSGGGIIDMVTDWDLEFWGRLRSSKSVKLLIEELPSPATLVSPNHTSSATHLANHRCDLVRSVIVIGLLSQINSGAEALRRSADGILDSGTLGAGAAGGLAVGDLTCLR